jgi:hypothetical protein
MYALSRAKLTESFSLIKVVKLDLRQKRCELLDIGVILLHQVRVLFESATDLLVLDLAFMVLIITTGHLLIAKEALHFEPLTLYFQMLPELKIIHLLFTTSFAVKQVLFAHFHMLLKL